ncbi:putative methyltransferase-domain-containing protein [Mycena rebaudengoi]|nr:putative methyltransferase-domain-containing protein [Mycena rebaudengoi]
MGKTSRRKKNPITTAAAVPTSGSSSKQASRTVIRRYHVLLKQQAQLKVLPSPDSNALEEINRQLEEIGGLKSYQHMSAIGQGNDRGGGSEKIAIPWLKEIYKPNVSSMLRLLEVGALMPDNYASCSSWIKTTPLDLHSRHPSILEQDFLLLTTAEHHEKWDVISLSLVLNFVSDARDRGRMLRLAHDFLVPGGHLFLALPLPCVLNSRYLTCEHLTALMDAIGFSQVKERWKAGGKMIYTLYRKQDTPNFIDPFTKKTVLRQGNRNNFSILL